MKNISKFSNEFLIKEFKNFVDISSNKKFYTIQLPKNKFIRILDKNIENLDYGVIESNKKICQIIDTLDYNYIVKYKSNDDDNFIYSKDAINESINLGKMMLENFIKMIN